MKNANDAAGLGPSKNSDADELTNTILNATIEVVRECGYEGARPADIAARAGVTTGALYTRFSHKEELVLAALDRASGTNPSKADVDPLLGGLPEAGDIEAARSSLRAGLLSHGPQLADMIRTELDHYEAARSGTSSFALRSIPAVTDAVANAMRISQFRRRLLATGACTAADIAKGRSITPGAARKWISRAVASHDVFVVKHEGSTLVPLFLLDDAFETRSAFHDVLVELASVGDNGWSTWTWLATPSSWLDNQVPLELIQTDAGAVVTAARRRAAAAA